MDSVDWNGGLEWCNGMVEWTEWTGMDYYNYYKYAECKRAQRAEEARPATLARCAYCAHVYDDFAAIKIILICLCLEMFFCFLNKRNGSINIVSWWSRGEI